MSSLPLSLLELPIVCCYRCRFFNMKVINTQISWLIHVQFSAQDHCSALDNSVSIIFLKGQISTLTCTKKKTFYKPDRTFNLKFFLTLRNLLTVEMVAISLTLKAIFTVYFIISPSTLQNILLL